jgi:hypothetical protein
MLQELLLENLEIVVDDTGQNKSVQLPWSVWETLFDYVRRTEENALATGEETEATGLCGIWDDPRPADEIVKEIISARSPSREINL